MKNFTLIDIAWNENNGFYVDLLTIVLDRDYSLFHFGIGRDYVYLQLVGFIVISTNWS